MLVLKQYWYESTGKKKSKLEKVRVPSDKTAVTLREISKWERKKVVGWQRSGRLTADGTLRLRAHPAPRTTARRIIRAFPKSPITLKEARAMVTRY